MSKSLRIFFIIIIALIVILPNFIQATNIDMNLTNNLDSNNITNGINQNLTNTSNSSTQNTNTFTPSNPQTVLGSSTSGSLSNLPEANLGLSNILSIILIVIGVLLILIRLKH